MAPSFGSFRPARQGARTLGLLALVATATALLPGSRETKAQGLDCNRLQAQIAQLDRRGGGRTGATLRRQNAEIARTQAYAHQLGCDGFAFFGGNPQCGGLELRTRQLQAGLAQLEAGGGGGGLRNDLVARYNAYCRPRPAQPRGFFESIFGAPQPQQEARPLPNLPPRGAAGGREDGPVGDDDEVHAHGGSQAVCVRTCDGGFFPLGLSTRRGDQNLNEMCSALCPGTEATVYTRNPDAEIKTAVSLDGKPYMDLLNALKFEKSASPTCSCHPAGKTWAEALAPAEDVLGQTGKGDIMVTKEKSDELSRPRLDASTRASLLRKPTTAMAGPPADAVAPDDHAAASLPAERVEIGPNGTKRTVRQVGPQP